VSCFAKENAPIQVIDTVGAGDSFLAGLIAAILTYGSQLDNEAHVQQLLRHAVASASLCVQEKGCVPPTWSQTKAWTLQHPQLS
jgi:fructokinase